MSERLFKEGDKVRMDIETVSGWKGTGTVTQDQFYKDSLVQLKKDDHELGVGNSIAVACFDEITLLKEVEQT